MATERSLTERRDVRKSMTGRAESFDAVSCPLGNALASGAFTRGAVFPSDAHMSYIEHSLGKNEALRYRARFPALYHVGAAAILAAGLATAFLLAVYELGWIGLVAAAIAAVAFLAIELPLLTTEIGVTSQRLIYKRGWIWRTTNELQLRAIEQVTLDQSLLGRLLNYGRVSVHGTGVDDIALPALAEPVALQRAIQEAIGAAVPAAASASNDHAAA
jgi:uncharacterized membrane protein YdbT with pleckstrin-like domain